MFAADASWLPNVVFLRAQFEQHGESVFPKRWAFIRYVSKGKDEHSLGMYLKVTMSIHSVCI